MFEGFKLGEVCVLVVIDIVVWGFDIVELFYVVNYDLLNIYEDYVYCIGCMGWVGVLGYVILFVIVDDVDDLYGIECFIGEFILCVIEVGFELSKLVVEKLLDMCLIKFKKLKKLKKLKV